MATARPVVSVYQHDSPDSRDKTLPMAQVMATPLRPDLVRYVHTNVSKNHRQPYANMTKMGNRYQSGYQHSAESWGTGRAVARVPRVSGGGTHGAGCGAFGNMCRGGGMFNPTKIWRRWHRRTNTTQKRHAVATALAASAVPALVMARGHQIDEVPELPLVVTDGAQALTKTKQAMEMLTGLGLGDELDKCLDSKKIKCGRGKSRNRRYSMRCGVLVIYDEDDGITRALRNIPGVETAQVGRLNLLRVAPGGTFGRMIVWTEAAFRKLGPLFGTFRGASEIKTGYHLLRPMMLNSDVARIINSDEVQSAVRPALEAPKRSTQKKNPLKNRNIMARLNPGIVHKKAMRARAVQQGTQEREIVLKKKRATSTAAKKAHKASKLFYSRMQEAYKIEEKADDEA